MVDGAALRVAKRRKFTTCPKLSRGGPQQLLVLGSEVGGRWNEQARTFLRNLVRKLTGPRPHSAQALVMLSAAVQQAVASTALGRPVGAPIAT